MSTPDTSPTKSANDPGKDPLPQTTHIECINAATIEAVKDPDMETLAADIDKLPVTWFVWVVALTASIAGLLFGYDTGIISGAIVYLGKDLDGRPVSSSEKELITSLCSGGAFFGAIFAGNTVDGYGRKKAIYLGSTLFIIGAALQASAYSVTQMAVGRFIVGLGVGSAAMVVPLYVAELAPARARGRLIGLNNMSITGGQVLAYAVGAGFAHVPHGWRYMVGLGGVPAVVLGCMMPWCPESPRYLVFLGRVEEARGVLARVYGVEVEGGQVEGVLRGICEACQQARDIQCGDAESGSGTRSRWKKVKDMHRGSNLRALIAACGLMVISQLSGFNALMYYSATVFSAVGFGNPTAVGLVVAGTNFVMTGVNMLVVDGVGRRRLLLCTVWGMSVGMVAVAVAFRYLDIDVDATDTTTTDVSGAAIAVLVFIIWFVVFYGVSVGNTAWMSADFFPLEVRAMGTMWMTCSNWASNVVVSSTFLSMMKAWTPSGAFGFFAGLCAVSYVLIYFFYPEVSGLVLEEIREVFEHGFGVAYARQLRKERRGVIEERIRTMDCPVPVGH